MLVAALESVHRKIYLHYKYKYKDDLNNEGGFDIWEYLNGTAPGSYAAPYFDDVSGWFFLLITAVLAWASYPAPGERPEPEVPESDEEE